MITTKKRIGVSIISTILGVGALTVAGGASAQAAGPNHSEGPYETKSECDAAKSAYVSSWTKISQACTYYPKQGGFTASGYYFHWRAVA